MMPEPGVEFCDVLIVGGGPAGLSVASHLGDDIASIVVHRDREIGLPVRTSGGSWCSDMEALGIPPGLYQETDRLELHSSNERAAFDLKTDRAVVLNVALLYRYLLSLSDAKNRRLYTATSFTGTVVEADGRYRSEVRRGGRARQIVSRVVVDASGWPCAVFRSLGKAARPGRIGVGHEHEFARAGGPANRAILFFGARYAPAGYGWVFPTNHGTVRIGLGVIRPETAVSPRQMLDAFLGSKAFEHFDVALGERLSSHSGIIPSVAFEPRLVFGNAVRVGDSANLATPVVGEGIRLAIRYGRMLGGCITDSMAGQRPRALADYERRSVSDLRWNYRLGFAANLRAAHYDDDKWDSVVRRLSRAREKDVIPLLRSEFSLLSALQFAARNVARKVAGGVRAGRPFLM